MATSRMVGARKSAARRRLPTYSCPRPGQMNERSAARDGDRPLACAEVSLVSKASGHYHNAVPAARTHRARRAAYLRATRFYLTGIGNIDQSLLARFGA